MQTPMTPSSLGPWVDADFLARAGRRVAKPSYRRVFEMPRAARLRNWAGSSKELGPTRTLGVSNWPPPRPRRSGSIKTPSGDKGSHAAARRWLIPQKTNMTCEASAVSKR